MIYEYCLCGLPCSFLENEIFATLRRTKVSKVEDLHYKITTLPRNHIKVIINPINNKITTYLSVYAYLPIMQQTMMHFENITLFFCNLN